MAVTLPVPVGVPSGLTWTDTGVGAKPARRERRARRLRVADEMPDVVEEDLVAGGKLAVGLVRDLAPLLRHVARFSFGVLLAYG